MGYKINEELIEKIHDSCDLVDIVSRYVHLKRSGSNFVGLCPFHNEKTPSFTVSESKQLFHCFGCGAGGDVITFIMRIENLSFVEAVKYLAEMQGIALEEDKNTDSQIKIQKQKIYEINRLAARYYYHLLSKNEKAIKYMLSRRVSTNTIKMFGLGYALDSWNNIYNFLKGKGFDEEDIEKSGLISRNQDNTKYYDKFRNRIMFPIIDTRNRVLGFGGRVLDDSKPKYLNSPDTLVFEKGKNLYGLNLVNKYSNREKVVLVEGYMDVVALHSRGINYAVASLGTSLTNQQAKLLKRYGKQVYICYDSDEAGIKATIRALNILRQEGVEPKVIILPEQYDPDDYIREKGLDAFIELENNALNYVDYNIFIFKKSYDLSSPEGKIEFTKKIAGVLKELKSPIEQDIYIDKISMDIGVSKEAIRREVLGTDLKDTIKINKDKYINVKKSQTKDIINPVRTVIEPAQLTAEKNLVALMIRNRDYFEFINKHLKEEDFSTKEFKVLYSIISQEYKHDSDRTEVDIWTILNRKSSHNNLIDIDVIQDIANIRIDESIENMDKFIKDLIDTVKISKLKREREEISKKIKEIEQKKNLKEQELEEFRRLCTKLMELDKELNSHL
jgi:DNA primase